MSRLNRGCTEYVETDVKIYFTPGYVACKYCPLLDTHTRKQCRRTGEYILDSVYETFVGRDCPLMVDDEIKENEEDK